MIYYVTFISHFDAIQYRKLLDKKKIKGVLQPVPRSLSSSCGTCVKFEAEEIRIENFITEGCEKIYREEHGTHKILYQQE